LKFFCKEAKFGKERLPEKATEPAETTMQDFLLLHESCMVCEMVVIVTIVLTVSLVPQEIHASITPMNVKPELGKDWQLEEKGVPAHDPLLRIIPRLLLENW